MNRSKGFRIKLHCLGGFREVGRNALLLENGKERLLLDYGIHPEEGAIPLPVQKVSAFLLAHPHLDHCGSAPILYRTQKMPAYATAATFDQSELILKDSLKIMRLENKERIFGDTDVRRFMANKKIVTFGQTFETKSASVEVIPAGHIPGSCCFVVDYGRKRVLYTSDFNTAPTRLLNGANISDFKDIDVVIMESTYSSRDHPPRAETEKRFIEAVRETVDNDGVALIPAFAVGRAAEMLMVLHSAKPDFPIYLDGMAKAATSIALRYPELLRNPKALHAAAEHATIVDTDEDRARSVKHPGAIITTSGMLEGGPIVWYLKRLYSRPECSLNFTGFQAPKTAGRYLQDTGRFVTEGFDLAVKMKMNHFDFSAHAGRAQLLDFVQAIKPEKVICMHGDYCERFATELRGRFQVDAMAPKVEDIVEI
ncbi:MAG: MBL fold metallo-hydrolase [Candidatus Aenigmatarchaeota archaeon]